MGGLSERIIMNGEVPALLAGGVSAAEVVRRLEAGEEPGAVADSLGLEAADVLAALAAEALGPEGSEGLLLVQGRPQRPKLAGALAEPSLAPLLSRAPRPLRLALAAGLLQVFDFWDASHNAAQEADDLGEPAFSAYWHGIAHRREPDPGNATYWFRRVGRHPLFGPLAGAASGLIGTPVDPDPSARGGWDPIAMIRLCSQARPGSAKGKTARRLQRLEMRLLLDATAGAALG